jgi:hypothetical protein
MGLLLLCMGVLFIVCCVLAFIVDPLWFAGGIAMFLIILLTPLFVGNTYPSDYHYKATVAGIFDQETSTVIYFEGYVQDGQTVTIDGYSYKNLHWLSFQNYDEFDKTIKIQIPDGKSFDYQVVNPLVQKVIN